MTTTTKLTPAQTTAIKALRAAPDADTVSELVATMNPRTRRALAAKGLIAFDAVRCASMGGWNGAQYTEHVYTSFRNIVVK
jgi:hypothetical protein